MFKRSLRIKVMAAMFSAAFLFGVNSVVNAYTYSGVVSNIDQPIYDKEDLNVTNKSYITSTQTINPLINDKVLNINAGSQRFDRIIDGWYWEDTEMDYGGEDIDETIQRINLSANDIKELKANEDNITKRFLEKDFDSTIDGLNFFKKYGEIYNSDNNVSCNVFIYNEELCSLAKELLDQIGIDPSTNNNGEQLYISFNTNNINKKADKFYSKFKELYPNLNNAIEELKNYSLHLDEAIKKNSQRKTNVATQDVENGTWGDSVTVSFFNKPLYSLVEYEGNINVSQDSTLKGLKDIKTRKNISVTKDSHLIAAGTITGQDIYSDQNIISTNNNQGEAIITPGNIIATGVLKSDTYIGAVSGGVSGNTVYSGGDIVSANSIKAGRLAKGNALNVAAINASSASITGNQSISGIFTTTGQAKLNSGAALGGKKITGLSIGTLSTTSTDAVNGKQLYTAMQSSSGKTYTAGSDISISSGNAISVAKSGKVASGDTGIMTGDVVYHETSKIDSIFKANNTSITSNNSKLDNLTTSIESLRKSLGTINSSVSDAISGLPGSLANFANKDLTDLSATGINTLKSYIKSEIKKQMSSNNKTASYTMEASALKDTSAIDNVIASKANDSDLTALEKKVDGKSGKDSVSLLEDKVNAKADLSYVNDGLDKKADQSVVQTIGSEVAKNTSAIAKNTASIQFNTEAISGLNNSKADVSGSNVDVSSWNTKLGTGTVAKDDTSLITGSSVTSALEKKADIGYVAMGLGAMEGSLEQVNQSVTKDVSRVGAGASALMGLHSTGDKFEFATAYGHYKNSNNTALGVFYKPSANSTVSMAGTIGDGDAMLSAGVSIKLGLNKEVKKVITQEEFGAIKAAVDSQDEKLDQMEKILQQLMAR